MDYENYCPCNYTEETKIGTHNQAKNLGLNWPKWILNVKIVFFTEFFDRRAQMNITCSKELKSTMKKCPALILIYNTSIIINNCRCCSSFIFSHFLVQYKPIVIIMQNKRWKKGKNARCDNIEFSIWKHQILKMSKEKLLVQSSSWLLSSA